MRNTWIRCLAGYALTVGVFGASAGADMILTLEPKDLDLNPISGGVPVGTRIVVDVSVSVDAEDDTGLVISALDLKFDASSDTIAVDSFSFLADMSAYLFQLANVDIAIGASPCVGTNCIGLTQQPTPLGRFEVTVNGPGEFNVIGTLEIGPVGGTQSVFTTAIDPANPTSGVRFSLSDGNLQGGIINLSVAGGSTGGGGAPPVDPPPASEGGTRPGDAGSDTILDPTDTNNGAPPDSTVTDGTVDPGSSTGSGVEEANSGGSGSTNGTSPPDASGSSNETPSEPTAAAAGDSADPGASSSPFRGRAPCGVAMVQTSIFILLGLSGMGRSRRRTHRRGAA